MSKNILNELYDNVTSVCQSQNNNYCQCDKFEDYGSFRNRFDDIKNKQSSDKLIHALLLLNKKFPNQKMIVDGAHVDILTLTINGNDCEQLTDDEILELIKYGTYFDDELDCLRITIT